MNILETYFFAYRAMFIMIKKRVFLLFTRRLHVELFNKSIPLAFYLFVDPFRVFCLTKNRSAGDNFVLSTSTAFVVTSFKWLFFDKV